MAAVWLMVLSQYFVKTELIFSLQKIAENYSCALLHTSNFHK